MLKQYLEELERRIDSVSEEQLFAEWKDFSDGKCTDGIFSPKRRTSAAPTIEWPEININDAIEDFEIMALDQFRQCSRMLEEGSGELMNVRCNYGTGIMPTLFGAELFMMPRETNTLPTSRPLTGGKAAVRALVRRGIPDLNAGLGGKVFEMGQHFLDMINDYPNVRQYIHLYHPDLQGPIDVCELLWGSEMFVDLIDVPDLAKELLELVTETYIAFMRRWCELVPPSEYSAHWSLLHKGTLMIRDDSAMNLSSRMFKQFIEPYDQRLLHEFGGGAIHFCGRGDHYIKRVGQMDQVFAINMSQPEYNDMETIFQNTVDKDIKIIGLPRNAAEEAINQGRDLRASVHCW